MLNIAHVLATAVAVDSSDTGAPAAQATQNDIGNGNDDTDQLTLSTQAQLQGSTFIPLVMSVLTNSFLLPARAATEPRSISPCTIPQNHPDPTMCVHSI